MTDALISGGVALAIAVGGVIIGTLQRKKDRDAFTSRLEEERRHQALERAIERRTDRLLKIIEHWAGLQAGGEARPDRVIISTYLATLPSEYCTCLRSAYGILPKEGPARAKFDYLTSSTATEGTLVTVSREFAMDLERIASGSTDEMIGNHPWWQATSWIFES